VIGDGKLNVVRQTVAKEEENAEEKAEENAEERAENNANTVEMVLKL
jgi:hypothetical protein